MKEKLTVLLVKPMEHPKAITIDDSLKAMQDLVGGNIQALYPFKEDVALVCNEDGKLMGLPLNRALMMNGEMVDILAGNFFIVAAPSNEENFASLSPEQLNKYEKMYHTPEAFVRTSKGIAVIPMPTKQERTQAQDKTPSTPNLNQNGNIRSVKL